MLKIIYLLRGESKILLSAVLWVIFVAIFSPSMAIASTKQKGKNSPVSSFATPDFAFPKTVKKDALQIYEKSMREKDSELALRAAMQLNVASALVSQDEFRQCVARFEEMSTKLPAPYSNLAMLIEAQMYGNYYAAQSWIYDNRTLPPDSIPTDVAQWSGSMFKSKIISLISNANKCPHPACDAAISNISSLLTNAEDAERANFKISDFLTLKSVDILSVINRRSNSDVSNLIINLLDGAIANNESDPISWLQMILKSRMMDFLSEKQCDEYSAGWLSEFIDTPYAYPFIIKEISKISGKNDNAARKQAFTLLSDYIEKFPDAYMVSDLRYRQQMLLQKLVELSFPQQALPSANIAVEASGANIYDFYILVYKLPQKYISSETSLKYGDLTSLGNPFRKVHISVAGGQPDMFRQKVEIEGLPAGRYAMVAAESDNPESVFVKDAKRKVNTLLVSGLSVITTSDSKDRCQLYVLNGENGAPVKNATVSYFRKDRGKRTELGKISTNEAGVADIPMKSGYYSVDANGEYQEGSFYASWSAPQIPDNLSSNILTSLSIYKPGDKVDFVAVLFANSNRQLSPAHDINSQITLYNANYEKVDSLSLTSDSLGRLSGHFLIPDKGLLGRYSLSLQANGKEIGWTSFDVAEYKAPTFIVSLEQKGSSSSDSGMIEFDGLAITYSGIPLSDAEVSYELKNVPSPWRYNRSSTPAIGGSLRTSETGKFHISIPLDSLRNDGLMSGVFSISASVTSAAGETQASVPLRFILGNEKHIVSSMPQRINISDAYGPFRVELQDLAGTPATDPVYYRISKDGISVKEGSFESPVFSPDLSKLKSGKYEFLFSMQPSFEDSILNVRDSVVIYSNADKRPPIATSLWLPLTKVIAAEGMNDVSIKVGSSYADSWILAMISDSEGHRDYQWLKVSDGFVSLRVPSPAQNERKYVDFYSIRNLEYAQGRVDVIPAYQESKLKLSAESFRDKIIPGERESWKFKFTIDGIPQSGIGVMAVMSDKALNSISPFKWDFNPYSSLYWPSYAWMSHDYLSALSNSYAASMPSIKPVSKPFQYPDWNFYGYSSFPIDGYNGGLLNRNIKIRGTATMKQARSEDAAVMDEAIMENVSFASAASSGMVEEAKISADGGSASLADADLQLRESETPIAFFMSDLKTDADGVATLDFRAPDFIGRWQLQIAAYSHDMKGLAQSFDVVSAKPLMAQLNAPRFVRSGDNLSVSASLMNADLIPLSAKGVMEFFNVENNSVLGSVTFPEEEILPGRTRVVTASVLVPDGISALGIRIVSKAGDFSDGEQDMVDVLPASAPIVESTPFWLGGAKGDLTLRLPEYSENASLTLNYCNNPIWQVVLSLPDIVTPQSVSVLSHADALYGNAVTLGLFRRYPKVKEGVSMLAGRDFASSSTPWVNDAAAQAQRMARLRDLAEDKGNQNGDIAELNYVLALQNKDGGWSWCPEMQSSEFATLGVLSRLSALRSMGFLPEEARSNVESAFGYLDKAYTNDWKRYKSFDTQSLLEYLYYKSSFSGIGNKSGFSSLDAEAMKRIRKDWRDFDIRHKSIAAILLSRRGEKRLASVILESLSQYATHDDVKGVWFDNARSSWSPNIAVLASASALRAFSEIEPSNPIVDGLKQYIVLSAQKLSWNDSRQLCAVVEGLLSSGSDWTVETEMPQIMIGDKLISLPGSAPLTGAFTMDISCKEASGELLTVSRSASSPAWGGVIAQYQAPVADVKSVDIPGLKIEKRLYRVLSDGTSESVESNGLKVGDKVRVELTVVTDANMEYVTVEDSRSACLQPTVQLSGYTSSDGVGYYREVRDSATNLFIPYLPKGTHILVYDCRVDRVGQYSLGIASVSSQLSPELTAHSAGSVLSITR